MPRLSCRLEAAGEVLASRGMAGMTLMPTILTTMPMLLLMIIMSFIGRTSNQPVRRTGSTFCRTQLAGFKPE